MGNDSINYDVFGYIGSTSLTVLYLPQVYQVYTTKKAEDLSAPTMLLQLLTSLTFLVYGYGINSYPILIANISGALCSICLLFGKYKYKVQKKQAEARKKQKTFEVKEVKLRPGIEDHDYGVKLKSIQRFLSEGDKVKITLRFKGREMAYHQRGFDVLKKLESAIEEVAKIEQVPTLEGKQMIMVLAPR
jgi:translation initiation factor IF-3